MELGAVTPARVLDALATAFAAADAQVPVASNEGGPAAPAGSSAPTVPGVRPTETSVDAMPDSTATPADARDVGPQAATLQTFGRPHAPVVEPLREADATLPNADHAGSEFAIPSDQLVQVLLTGLQVEAMAAWPLLRNGVDTARTAGRRDAETASRTADEERAPDETAHAHEDGEAHDDDDLDHDAAVPHAVGAAVEPDWCDAPRHARRVARRRASHEEP